jgi:CHAT domain-containing protein/tetratricopeptide (TPR) repeat protein
MVAEEQIMRPTFGRLGVLMLLPACLSVAAVQPVPLPADKAAKPAPAEQRLLDKATQLNAEGLRCDQRGDFARALLLLQEALMLRRQAYPPEKYPDGHADLAQSLNNLGTVYRATGDYARAEPVQREALAMCRALYPKERFPSGHLHLAFTIHNLGRVHQDAGDCARAEPLLREALALCRALYPKERFAKGHPDLAESLNNLGIMYRIAGEYAKAEPCYREALAMRRAVYPPERFPDGHRELAQSLNNLGELHRVAGDYARAERLHREALAMHRALYPKERFPKGHADLAISLAHLGVTHLMAREFAQAEPLLYEALAMTRVLYPPERFPHGHPELARRLNSLGGLYWEAGDYARAERLYGEALAMRRALYPPARFPHGHPDLAHSLINLGALHQSAGEYGQAETLYREALAIYRARYPKERFPHGHPELANSLNNLASLYDTAGDYARAERLYHEALAMRRALYSPARFPKGHPELGTTLHNLGVLYRGAGGYARAAPFFREALTMRRAVYPRERYPDGHPEVAGTLNSFGGQCVESGDYAQAEPLLCEALAMRRALYRKERFPHGHPDLALSLNNVAFLRQCTGEHAKAEPLWREALAMYGELLRQYAELAAEAESRNFAGSLPLTRDGLLSGSRHVASSAAAYEAIWDGRAVLTRAQERRHRDILASADPATAALADELRLTRRSLARLLLHPGRNADSHRQAALQLTQAKEDLEKRIAAKLRLTRPQAAAARTTVQQLSAALPGGTVYVDFLRYVAFEQDPGVPGKKGEKRTARYVAFVVRSGQPVARIELHDAAPIEEAWAAWCAAIIAGRTERPAARTFARLVWEPIRAALPADCQAVYLTPDGALTKVPWVALPGRQPERVLLEEYAVCLVPHGPWLLECLQEKTAPRAGNTLLAYGGIDYEGAPSAVAKGRGPRDLEVVGEAARPVSADKRLHWAALPGTAREQAQIVAPAKKALTAAPIIRSGRVASTEQLLEDLPKARYAHLATHGFFADPQVRSFLQVDPKLYEMPGWGERRSPGARSPLVLSGLVLAGANRQGEDAAPDHGIVTAEGLIGLRLEGLELAVLSACETGLGEVAGGEGVFGLQRVFHLAGTRSVVASLWKIDDAATQALMAEFYRNLWERKQPKLEALRRAQLAMLLHYDAKVGQLRAPGAAVPVDPAELAAARQKLRTAGRPPLPPLYWAGFVLSGDWR